MNIWKKSILLGGCVAALTLFAGNQAMAQRNFDPAQFRQMRVDRAKASLEVKDEDWKAIEPLVGKVIDAQTEVMRGGFGRGMGGQRRNRGGATNDTTATPRPQRQSPFGEPSAAVNDLQKAIDDNAPVADLKAKIAAVRAENKEKEQKLEAAQDELRSVLTTKQEAQAILSGLLR